MNDFELNEKKKELMKPGWTEDLHHSLEELQDEDAKKIVESMTDDEVYRKVNNRRFQEDYIADYLEYLWDISESSFWRHVITTLDVNQNILWSDNMFHFKMLCCQKIPNDVLDAVLKFIVECAEDEKLDLDTIGCVIKAQVDNFERLNEVRKYISLLDVNKQSAANERIHKMLSCDCNYNFD